MQAIFPTPIKEQFLCLKRKMAEKLAETPKMLRSNKLAELLQTSMDKILVIDSRSFLEYNTCHVHNSVNVGCSKLIKRRLQQDKVTIRELLSSSCKVDADDNCEVIVYDQCTSDASGIQAENFLSVLLKKLSGTFRSVSLLTGGFADFQSCFPSLCESQGTTTKFSALAPLSQPCMPIANVGPTKILPYLYVGSQQDVFNQDLMHTIGIEYVLNISKTCPIPNTLQEGHFCRIPVNDNYGEKILPWFDQAIEFINKVQSSNGKVIVHCLAGVSRSATIAIAYVMKHLHMSSDDAYRYVKDKRPTISPNFNFLGQLLEFEKKLKEEDKGNDGVITTQPIAGDVITPQPRSPSPYRDRRFHFNRITAEKTPCSIYESDNQPSERKRTKVSNVSIKVGNTTANVCVSIPQGRKSPQRPTGLDVNKLSHMGPLLGVQTCPGSTLQQTQSESQANAGGRFLRQFSFKDDYPSPPLSGQNSPQLTIRSVEKPSGKPVSPESLRQVDYLTSALSVNSPDIKLENPFAVKKTKLADIRDCITTETTKISECIAMETQDYLEPKITPGCQNLFFSPDVMSNPPEVKVSEEVIVQSCPVVPLEDRAAKVYQQTNIKKSDTIATHHEDAESKNSKTWSQQIHVETRKKTGGCDEKNEMKSSSQTGKHEVGHNNSAKLKSKQTKIKTQHRDPKQTKQQHEKVDSNRYVERKQEHFIEKIPCELLASQQVMECFAFQETTWTPSKPCKSRDFMLHDDRGSTGSVESMDCHFQDMANDMDDTNGNTLSNQRSLCGSCEMIEVS